MKDCENIDPRLINDTINEPVSAVDTFSKLRPPVLWNDSPDRWKVGKATRKFSDALKETLRG